MGVDLDHTLDTVLGNIVDDGVLEFFIPQKGPDWYIIRQRDEEFVMGDDFPPAVRDERERAIEHIQSMDPPTESDDQSAVADGGDEKFTNDDGETLREVVANDLSTKAGQLEAFLRSGRARDQRSKLNDVVESVEASEFTKPDTYDEITLIPKGRRYHFDENVIRSYGLA